MIHVRGTAVASIILVQCWAGVRFGFPYSLVIGRGWGGGDGERGRWEDGEMMILSKQIKSKYVE
ncbi:MAG: hypothetical protein F6J89_19160 [Symploca sp. SIO1C4]|uniref:Uncharacterized protein n=1 Tax=Symploca sp. SIO1C4 TaxID=2607765 RepID=A0A6B3NGJ4_9CYAN|nr:hypothetical protein [Symploca sp. SIO1C4]